MNDDKEKRQLTPEESQMWDKVTEQDERWKEIEEPEVQNQVEKEEIELPTTETEISQKPKSFTVKERSELQIGETAGLDGRTAMRLKRGRLRIEETLDLHGMTQSEAMYNLKNFIKKNYQNNRRCVLVITGKGIKPDGSVGVLRENTPKWLNDRDIRPMILAFNYAQQKDGGRGALYVLLKRKT